MGSVKLLVVVVAALVLAPAAGAQTELADVAQQLRSQPVYVDPSTDLVSDEEASSLRRQIDEEAAGLIVPRHHVHRRKDDVLGRGLLAALQKVDERQL